MKKNTLVVKSNALIETSYRLTTNEQRIILACISQIRRNDPPPTDQVMYSISVSDFSKLFETSSSVSYRDLKEAALKLKRREVRITQEPNGKGALKETLVANWVQTIKYSKGSGEIRLRFNHDIIPYITQLNKCFTSYNITNIVKMSSSYGVRLYELLAQWGKIKKKEVSLEWLRDIFQLEKKYKEMSDFRKRVLIPAINDINQNSNIWVEIKQKKTGRKITHIIFEFGSKEEKQHKKTREQQLSGIKYFGIDKNILDKKAKPGESYEQAAFRLKKETIDVV